MIIYFLKIKKTKQNPQELQRACFEWLKNVSHVHCDNPSERTIL